MAYMHDSGQDEATRWFVDRLGEQEAAHDGHAMRTWARLVLQQLPAGPLELVSTSIEGCALAAVVAALREEGVTRWRHLVLGREGESSERHAPAVVIEAVEIGPGFRAAIEQSLPGAIIISGVGRQPIAVA